MDWLHKKAFWMSLASIVDIILKGVPPLNLESSIKDGIKYIKAYGGLLQGGVPSGYTALEYIESTGEQYINTGIPTQDGIGFDVTFLTNSTIGNTGNYGCILGGRKASGNNDVQITTFGNPAGNIRYGSQTGNNAGIVNNQKLHVSLINRVATLNDGTTYTVPSYTFGESNNIYLFGLNNNGTLIQTGSGCRIYNAKLYVNSNVVADFIPVKRNSDSVLGMYDAVSGKFYTNAGTGTFTAGNEIVPTPSDPMDIVCNNGALKILDKSAWTIFTNPTSIAGQGVWIDTTGMWKAVNDNGAGCAIPLTIGKQYTLVIHKKTAGLGTILRYGQSPQETPTSEGVQLTDWYRGDITDGQIISFVAKQPYLVMQLSAVAVEAGMVQEAIEVLEAQGGDYTFLKYIEATGTQYIETGLSGPARWVGAGQGTSDSVGSKCILSALTSSANVYLASRFGTSQVAGKSWTIGITHSQVPTLSYAEYDIDFASNSFTGTINGEAVSRSNTFTFTTWTIGTAFGTGTTQYPFVGYIYRQQAYQNNVLVGDFIPAIRNSDNVVGMYDTVSGTFFTNAGTGVFVAGTPLGDGEVLKLTPSNDTAGVANLLKIDDYVDTQEILTGLINHQLGILVLNGLETYNVQYSFYIHSDSCDAFVSINDVKSMSAQDAIGACTHLKLEKGTIWSGSGYPNTFTFNTTQLHMNFAHDVIGTTSSSTTEEASAAIKSYIAAQYAAGTPVIIVYPLATAQDEVAPVPQTMQTTAGDNVLDIVQAGMSGLEVEIKYTKG